MRENKFKELLEQFKAGRYTEAEWNDLRQAINAGQFDELLHSDILNEFHNAREKGLLIKSKGNRIKESASRKEYVKHIEVGKVREKPVWRMKWWWAAALLVGLAGTYMRIQHHVKEPVNAAVPAAILPGADKAILTLANGSKVDLMTQPDGKIAAQDKATITKSASGISYDREAETTGFHILTTPRGGQFQVSLPDGTRVWLNAASSLRYPIAFQQATREVDLTGEAYFEVTPDRKKPFIVHAGETAVTVLGTEFNVMAYSDEPSIRTTLLHGAVEIEGRNQHSRITPGMQAIYNLADKQLFISNPDVKEVTAWKDGRFSIKEVPFPALMRQLERWYDIDIEYPSSMPEIQLAGTLSRRQNAGELFDILSATVNFKYEIMGRKIKISL